MIFNKITRKRIFKASAFLLSSPCPLVAPARRSFIVFIALNNWTLWIQNHECHIVQYNSPSRWENCQSIFARHCCSICLFFWKSFDKNRLQYFSTKSQDQIFTSVSITRPLRVKLIIQMITNWIFYQKYAIAKSAYYYATNEIFGFNFSELMKNWKVHIEVDGTKLYTHS